MQENRGTRPKSIVRTGLMIRLFVLMCLCPLFLGGCLGWRYDLFSVPYFDPRLPEVNIDRQPSRYHKKESGEKNKDKTKRVDLLRRTR